MKFIELEIKNIASIGYAKISFEEAPLCNEPLFLICGPTGSGKSTILDAV
ncbi:MAG: AAA family ATPase, partial [Bacteroidaceae bacterium]|nr:AAA family ATPase [Bacteroidaceae bacterium]